MTIQLTRAVLRGVKILVSSLKMCKITYHPAQHFVKQITLFVAAGSGPETGSDWAKSLDGQSVLVLAHSVNSL